MRGASAHQSKIRRKFLIGDLHHWGQIELGHTWLFWNHAFSWNILAISRSKIPMVQSSNYYEDGKNFTPLIGKKTKTIFDF